MAATHHEFADSESASFLYEDAVIATPRKSLWARISWYVPYVLLVLGILLAAVIIASPKDVHDGSTLPSQATFGRVSTKAITFKPNASYNVDPFGPDEIDTPWNELAPPGKGHVKINDPAAWQLSGGFPLKDPAHPHAEEYTIALFHQIHCLAAIKSKMTRLQEWYQGENDKEYLAFALGEDQVSEEHINHCFDYLRQALLCHGDTTLEKARVIHGGDGDKIVRGVDGWDVAHECRDYDAIYDFAKVHRSQNESGIA